MSDLPSSLEAFPDTGEWEVLPAIWQLLGNEASSAREYAAELRLRQQSPIFEGVDEKGVPWVAMEHLQKGKHADIYCGLYGGCDTPIIAKVLKKNMNDENRIARFRQEPNFLRILKGNGAPRFVGTIEIDGAPGILMSHHPCVSLRDFLNANEGRRLSRRFVHHISLELARVLSCIHKERIIHRDIKPENIILTDEGKILCIDFGLATQEGEKGIPCLTGESVVMGTAPYIADESLLQGSRKDTAAVDIYALGAVLYELHTSRLLYENMQEASERFDPKRHEECEKKIIELQREDAFFGNLLSQLLARNPFVRPNADDIQSVLLEEMKKERANGQKLWKKIAQSYTSSRYPYPSLFGKSRKEAAKNMYDVACEAYRPHRVQKNIAAIGRRSRRLALPLILSGLAGAILMENYSNSDKGDRVLPSRESSEPEKEQLRVKFSHEHTSFVYGDVEIMKTIDQCITFDSADIRLLPLTIREVKQLNIMTGAGAEVRHGTVATLLMDDSSALLFIPGMGSVVFDGRSHRFIPVENEDMLRENATAERLLSTVRIPFRVTHIPEGTVQNKQAWLSTTSGRIEKLREMAKITGNDE